MTRERFTDPNRPYFRPPTFEAQRGELARRSDAALGSFVWQCAAAAVAVLVILWLAADALEVLRVIATRGRA